MANSYVYKEYGIGTVRKINGKRGIIISYGIRFMHVYLIGYSLNFYPRTVEEAINEKELGYHKDGVRSFFGLTLKDV